MYVRRKFEARWGLYVLDASHIVIPFNPMWSQCNAQRCITGKRWIDIWSVFINLDFEMRFDNITRETSILYIDLAETLNFLLRYLIEKVARINNRKTVRANSLVTAHSLRVCVCCC